MIATLRTIKPAPLIVGAAAFLAPILGLANGLAVAPLLSVAALALLLVRGWRHAWWGALDSVQWITIILLLAWAAISLAWTPAPLPLAARSWAMTLGTFVIGAALISAARTFDDSSRAIVTRALAAGLLLSSIVLLIAAGITRIDTMTGDIPQISPNWLIRTAAGAIMRFDRDSTIIALLLWPALAGLIRLKQIGWAIGLMVVSVVALLLSHDLSAKVAVFAGFAVAVAVRLWARPILAGLAIVLPLLLVAAPSVAARLPLPESGTIWARLPLSERHRLAIWRFVAESIGRHPLRGWGLEASREVGQGHKVVLAQPNGPPLIADLLPLHPHDAGLQIWLELGPFGIVLAGMFLGTLIWRLRAGTGAPMDKAGAAAALIAGLVVLSVSYGFWQSWWLCSLWLAGALMVIMLRTPTPASIGSR